ncbi:MAG: hypothetical protein IT204_06340 [Fimbriimonadaceae bacterium]|nr:hypothetical protein [Fimbriimonadaceae bacterium]
MATSLEEVCNLLRRDGRTYRIDLDGDQVTVQAAGTGARYSLLIRLSEEGECLHLRIPRVVTVGQSPHAAALFARILELHYAIKLGRFGLDPNDGEIDCEIVMPLDDLPLTARLLRRLLGTLVLLVDQQKPRFEHLLATGQDPAGDDDEHLETFLDQVAATLGMTRAELDRQLAQPAEEAS